MGMLERQEDDLNGPGESAEVAFGASTSSDDFALKARLKIFFDSVLSKHQLTGPLESFWEKCDALHRLYQERGMALHMQEPNDPDLDRKINDAEVSFNARRHFLVIGAETQYIEIPPEIDELAPHDVTAICEYIRGSIPATS